MRKIILLVDGRVDEARSAKPLLQTPNKIFVDDKRDNSTPNSPTIKKQNVVLVVAHESATH